MKAKLRISNNYISPDFPDNSESHTVTLQPAQGGGGVSAGTLNTDNTAAQTPSANESLGGAVKLHKVSKTGSYNDLRDKPDLSDIIETITEEEINELTNN